MKFYSNISKILKSTVKLFSGAFFLCLLLSIPNEVLSQKIELKLNDEHSQSHYKRSELIHSALKDSNKKNTGNVTFKMKKSPWKAVAYSAILPGAGQFYNESYWKIPVIAGLGGYFVYEWIKNNNTFLDYKEQYQNSQTPENPQGNLQLQALREFYRDQRDNFIIYSVILYVVNLIDAYVDAQLYDFDVSDNIKFGVMQKEGLLKLSYGF